MCQGPGTSEPEAFLLSNWDPAEKILVIEGATSTEVQGQRELEVFGRAWGCGIPPRHCTGTCAWARAAGRGCQAIATISNPFSPRDPQVYAGYHPYLALETSEIVVAGGARRERSPNVSESEGESIGFPTERQMAHSWQDDLGRDYLAKCGRVRARPEAEWPVPHPS